MQVTQSSDTYNPETFVDFLYPDEHDVHTGRPQYRTKVVRNSEQALLENMVNEYRANHGLFWVGTFSRYDLEDILRRNRLTDILSGDSFSTRDFLDFLYENNINTKFFFGREYSAVVYIDLPEDTVKEMAHQLNADEVHYRDGIGMWRLWWD